MDPKHKSRVDKACPTMSNVPRSYSAVKQRSRRVVCLAAEAHMRRQFGRVLILSAMLHGEVLFMLFTQAGIARFGPAADCADGIRPTSLPLPNPTYSYFRLSPQMDKPNADKELQREPRYL